jgi:hypothetical protein
MAHGNFFIRFNHFYQCKTGKKRTGKHYVILRLQEQKFSLFPAGKHGQAGFVLL